MAEGKRSFLEPAVLARLLALPLHARQAMLGSVSGKHRSPIRGSSLEFAQYRKYVPGDDTRRLDWRTWGRSDRFYIKEFEADTNLRLCLLIDTSGSMDFGPAGATRLDYARRLAGTLGYLAAQQGDAVGLWSIAQAADRNPRAPRRRASRARARPDGRACSRAGGTTLLAALHDAAEKIRQRALVVIFSDLFVPPAELKARHPAPPVPQARRRGVSPARPAGARLRLRPAGAVRRPGGRRAVLADPSLIARNYREAVRLYLAEMDELVRDDRASITTA